MTTVHVTTHLLEVGNSALSLPYKEAVAGRASEPPGTWHLLSAEVLKWQAV